MRYQYAYFQPENIKSDQTKVQVAQSVSVYSNQSLSKFHLVAKIMKLTVTRVLKLQLNSFLVALENHQIHTSFFEVVD